MASNAGAEPIAKEDYIGTGPYRFTDWRPNRYVELSKFDDYAALDSPASGLAGARMAKLDKIHFAPVPDVATRVSGVQAGDYDYAEFVPGDLYEDLSADSSVKIHVNGAPIFGMMFVNSKEGLLKDNYKLRRAVQMALNKEEALRVSIGPELLWDANGSFYPKGNAWYSESGIGAFSQADPEGAKALAKEAGYDGEPIKLLVSTNYQFHYDQAAVFTKHLAEGRYQCADGRRRLGDIAQEAGAAGSVGHLLYPPRYGTRPCLDHGPERFVSGLVDDRYQTGPESRVHRDGRCQQTSGSLVETAGPDLR